MIAEVQWFMPVWSQILVSLSVLIIAVGIIWKRILKPAASLITLLDKAVPMLKDLVDKFEDQPHAFAVLNEIAIQFKTDSGSSLRDVVNRLEAAANENKASAIKLAVNLKAESDLAQQTRDQVTRLTAVVKEVNARVQNTGAGISQIQAGARHIATELEAGRKRADDIPASDNPGKASDAAVRSHKEK